MLENLSLMDLVPQLSTGDYLKLAGAGALIIMGYRLAAKGVGMVMTLVGKFSLVGLASAVLFIGAVTSGSFSLGELAVQKSEAKKIDAVGVTDAQLAKFLEKSGQNTEQLKTLLDYTMKRDRIAVEDRLIERLVKEGDHQAVAQYLKYLESKDRQEVSSPSDLPTAYTSTSLHEPIYRVNESPRAEGKRSVMRTQDAYALTGAAIATLIVGIVMFANKKESPDYS